MRFRVCYKVNGSKHTVTDDRFQNMPDFNEPDLERIKNMRVGDYAEFNNRLISVKRLEDKRAEEFTEDYE